MCYNYKNVHCLHVCMLWTNKAFLREWPNVFYKSILDCLVKILKDYEIILEFYKLYL